MSSEWQSAPFSKFCDITRGASPRPIHDYLSDEGMSWIKIADATDENSRFISNTKEKIKLDGVKASVKVFPNDLILSNSATPGLPKFLKIEACIHDGWMLLRNFRDLDIQYAYWLLLNERPKLVAQGNGSVFTNLKTDILKSHIVTVPPLSIQKDIAAMFNNIDDRITLLRETNAILEATAQALLKSWFVDFDPVRAKSEGKFPEGMDEATAALFPDSFEQSELGEIPTGWEIKNLGQVAYNVKSRIKNAEDWKNLDLLDLSRMPRKILFPFEYGKGKELSTSVFEFKKDDCLFGAVRPYFHKVCHATRNGVTNSSVLIIRSLVPENQFFINLVASSKECVTHATSYSQGTKMPTINWENLSRFSIVCPPDNLQSIFCEYVSLFFKKALNNSLIINLLTELRDVLLPRLVTGQLKLPNSREINNKTMENH